MTLEGNIGVALLNAAKRHSGRTAFVAPDGNLSYAEVGYFINALAMLMRRNGVGRDSCVALEVSDARVVIVGVAACALLGAAWTDGDPRSVDTVAKYVTHTLVETARTPGLKTHGKAIVFDPAILAAAGKAEAIQPIGYASTNDMSRIGLSSGSTGRQKAIWISAASEWERVNWEYTATKGVRNLMTLCMFPPKSGVGINTRIGTLLCGGAVLATFAPDLVKAGKVNQIVGSPAQIATLMRALDQSGIKTKLPLVLVGGGRPSAEFMENLRRRVDQITVFYGSTEMGNIAEYPHAEREDYDGRLMVHDQIQLEIVDDDDQPVPAGTVGHIRLKSETGMPRYFDEAANASAFRNGWFYGGDRGYLSDEGYLHILGRSDDTANLGGVKVDMLAYDEFVQTFAGVEDGYCFLTPDDMGVDRLSVIVRFNPGTDQREAAAKLLREISGNKHLPSVPRAVFVSDTIPRTETGKPAKHLAKELAEAMTPIVVAFHNPQTRPPRG